MNWRESDLLQSLIEKARPGLITDMDGTISPIVDYPDEAQITPKSRQLLRALQSCLSLVAIVSGRSADDVRQRVGLSGLVYIGNHGLERWNGQKVVLTPTAARFRPNLEAASQRLSAQMLPGMLVEDKGATLSIHYRKTENPTAAAKTFGPILESIAHEYDLHLFWGRMVFELRPPVEVNKGTVFRQVVEEYDLDDALYIGDDTTDVDALRMARHLRAESRCYAVGVGVESPDMPDSVAASADIMASGVSDVEALLDWLFKARRASSTCM